MGKAHLIVLNGPNGVELHSLKRWLRDHPEEVPSGLSPDHSTSHALRAGLKKRGWTMDETADEVRLSKPGGESAVEVADAEPEETPQLADEEFGFALENQLRDFIACNLQTISVGGHRLRLYKNLNGRTGVEFPTRVGPIDILAVNDSDDFFVFELKLDRGPDRTMGQLLRYMGWVHRELAKGKRVYGVIVARSIHEKLNYSAIPVSNVFLLEYEIDFRLRESKKIAAPGN